jgi:Fic family protein
MVLNLLVEIGEWIGRYQSSVEGTLTPQLRRGNRIRTIQASLAIENNTLTLEQVTDVLDGKRVMGLPREIQEVRNAFAAYEKLTIWDPNLINDLFEAHSIMTSGLVDETGTFRRKSVGIFQEKKLIHMAPAAKMVPKLMDDLIHWLKSTQEHPLVASCVFHYEFEFIHPFADGNGRMGRLWQTLILSRWHQLWAFLPVEDLVRARQNEYYEVLGNCDTQGDCTLFVEFMMQILRDALVKSVEKQQSVSKEKAIPRLESQLELRLESAVAAKIVIHLYKGTASKSELAKSQGHKSVSGELNRQIQKLLEQEIIERTIPDKPNSRLQKYRLTEMGRKLFNDVNGIGHKKRS